MSPAHPLHVDDASPNENGFEYAVPGKPESRRRFFQSVARWDARYQTVIIPGRDPMPLLKYYRSDRSRAQSPPKKRRFYDRFRDIARAEEESQEEDEDEDDEEEEEDEETSRAIETEFGDDEDMSVVE